MKAVQASRPGRLARWAAQGLGALVCAIGILALVYRLSGAALPDGLEWMLTGLRSAAAFALIGAALLVRSRWPLGRAANRVEWACRIAAAAMAGEIAVRVLAGATLPSEGMSPLSALLFLLSAAAGACDRPPISAYRFARSVAVAGLVAVLAVGLAVIGGYALGVPWSFGERRMPISLLSAIAFVALSGGQLLASPAILEAVRRAIRPDSASEAPHWLPGAIVACTTGLVVLAVSGLIVFFNGQATQRYAIQEDLNSVADLKVQQIEQWRRERLNDAEGLRSSPRIKDDVAAFLARPGSDTARRQAAQWMHVTFHGTYQAAVLFDRDLEVRLSTGTDPPSPDAWLRSQLATALRRNEVTMTDLHRAPDSTFVYQELLLPIPDPGDEAAPPIAVIDLRVNANRFLFPLIQAWPAHSRTAETLLVERVGDEVLYLNNLRHLPDTALTLKLPMRPDLPASMALLQLSGQVEGVDYRNVRVLAAFRSIPDTPWSLVAKEDEAEAYATLQQQALLAGGLAGGVLLVTVIGLGLVWRQRGIESYRRALALEHERAMLSERYRYLSQHANDLILMCNDDLSIIEANDSAMDSFGYTLEEFKRKTLRDLLESDSDAGKLFVSNGGEPRIVSYCRSNGQCFFAETNIGSVDVGGTRIHQAILRDVTDRLRAEEAQRLAAMVYDNSMEAIMVTDENNRVISVNRAFTDVTGYTADEILGRNPSMLASGRQDEAFYESMWAAIHTTGHWQGEVWNKHKDGRIFAEWLSINTIRNPDGTVHRYVALFFDITEKKRSDDKIWHQANFDRLTGLPNRSLFRNQLDHEVMRARREGEKLALMFIDLDYFKDINDTLGHDAGDKVLMEAAGRIRDCMRESDTVARLGGDEFVAILGDIDDDRTVERIAQDILHKMTAPFQLGRDLGYLSASVGIAFFPADAQGPDDLLRHADHAMYDAKLAGRNSYRYFTVAMQQAAARRARLATDLRGALEHGQFRVHFQPIVELATGSIHKAEALVRWQHPERGLILPDEFIPLAERVGLVSEIGDWVLEETIPFVKRLRAGHHPAFQISVNRSPAQFHTTKSLAKTFLARLRTQALPEQSIVIEITEGLLLDASPRVKEALMEFRDGGVEISIDDFGTGYSSLSYLQQFDIDYLKIDQSFVHDLGGGHNQHVLCEAIIVMAHKLGLKVIAEGVETEAQRDLLAGMGSDYGQGYFFSRPMPAGDFEAMLRTPH